MKACAAGTDFEAEKYRIRQASVEDPFKFLYWSRIRTQFNAMLGNQLYTSKLRSDGFSLVEKARSANSDARFVVRFEGAYVQNCDAATKTLDLLYRIYSTDPPLTLGGATESQAVAETSPQTTAGLTQGGSPFHFTPTGGYDRSDGVFGGGRMQVTPKLAGFRLFDTFTAQGQGSHSMHSFSAALSGSANLLRPIRKLDWRIDYQNDLAPGGGTSLAKAGLSGQMNGETQLFWKGSTLARFGGLLQGGNMHSDAPSGLLALQTVSNAGYGSVKGYLGLSSRTSHNVVSASYGLELGSVGPAARVDWRKHIGDVTDEFWIPVGDHKPFEVESRFTAGGIQVPHSVPLPVLFFGGDGGDGSEFFVPGDAWQIRDEPVIRAIPANRLFLTSQGIGADRFASLNLTLSYPVKVQPIMPKELSTDPEFQRLLHGQIVSAASVEQNYYSWKDPNFAAALKRLPHLKQLLASLLTAVTTAQTAHPNTLQDEFTDCTTNISVADFDATNALAAKDVSQYGNLAALLPVDSGDLAQVHTACALTLNRQLNDPGIEAATAAVDAARTAILNDFNAIDQKLAARLAASDIAFVSRTLNTLFRDLNIFSIGPVAVFDTAWIGPAKGDVGGNRIGPGGGVRLELASYVNFTLGYAWNVDRKPGEGGGALFFSIGLRDLFR